MGISDILAELDRMKRSAMKNWKDSRENPALRAEMMQDRIGQQLGHTGWGDRSRPFDSRAMATTSGGNLGFVPSGEAMMDPGDFLAGGAGTLIGKGARGFSQPMADKAVALAKKGATPQQIWNDVPLNYMTPSGQVLQEITDHTAKINAPWLPNMAALKEASTEASNAFEWAKMMRNEGKMSQEEFEPYLRRRLQAENAVKTPPRQDMPNQPMSQFLDHPELYENYPSIAKMDLAVNPHTRGAFHSPDNNLISIGTKDAESAQSLMPVTMHEVGHEGQNIEGLPRGGGPELFSKYFGQKRMLQNQLLSDQAAGRDLSGLKSQFAELKQNPLNVAKSEYDAYRRLYGEQLSDAVQFRADKDLDWRKSNFFGHDLTAPVEQTLWRNREGVIYPAPLRMPNLGGYGGEKRVHSTAPMPDQLNMEWIRKYGGM